MPNIDLDDSQHPDTPTYAGDKNACGPASAANSLKWLDTTYAEINIPGNLRDVMEELSGLMNRPRNGGVGIENFIRGKLEFIEDHGLPINVKFQSKFLSGNVNSSGGATRARNDNTGTYPTWSWLQQQIDDGEDVEMMYHWWDGEKWRGHAVVVTGVEESATGRKTVKFKHDARQRSAGGTTQESENIYVDSQGRMILRSRNAFVGSAVAESPGDPFPVELKSFAAVIISDGVELNWSTASESNNYGFELYRDYEKIAFLKGHDTTSEPQVYSYVDKTATKGLYYYELYQIDYDGTRVQVAELNVDNKTVPADFFLAQNYPNPFNSKTIIRFSLSKKSFVTLKVFNLLGSEIFTLIDQEREAGLNSIELDAERLESGVYIYQLQADGFSLKKKFILLK